MRLVWDEIGKRYYETGVQNGVFYIRNSSGLYPNGIPWNGLISFTESPSGAESNKTYADNMVYLNLVSTEELGGTIEAYTYPDEFSVCDGSGKIADGVYMGQQPRQMFGFSYKTILGNDVSGNDLGYKLHLVYGCNAAPSEKEYGSTNDSTEPLTFSWEITTTPVDVATAGFKPTASITIDSTKVDSAKLATLENILYGTESTEPRLPLPDEIYALFASTIEALALSSIVPDDEASNVAITSKVTVTFNNKIYSECIVVVAADGTLVAGTKAWDTAGKVLTFTPSASLTNAKTYIVAIAGVVDIYAQALATTSKNFATVA